MRILLVLFFTHLGFAMEQPTVDFVSIDTESYIEKVEEKNSLTSEAFSLKEEVLSSDNEDDAYYLAQADGKISQLLKYGSFRKRSLEIGIEYPTHFGLNLKYYLENTVYTRVSVSFMGSIFLEAFEKTMPFFGYYNQAESQFISDALSDSLYTELRFGWFPWSENKNGGFYMEAGLSGSFFGGGDISGTNLSAVLADSGFNPDENYIVRTNTINGTFHVGYQILIEKLTLNLEAGIIRIINADLEERFDDVDELAGTKLSVTQKQNVKQFLEERGWVFPTLSVSMGFSF